MITENLTPGGKLSEYSDGELFRSLRHGISSEGRLLGFMPLLGYSELSDEDIQAIIAYLRSLPPVEQPIATGDFLNFLGSVMYGAGMFGEPKASAASVSAPPEGVTAEFGMYVAMYGDCRGCHGPDLTGVDASSMSPGIPNPRPLIGTLSQEEFAEMMRTGIKPGGKAFPETMPWQNAARMTDDDLAALYTYLTTPVK